MEIVAGVALGLAGALALEGGGVGLLVAMALFQWVMLGGLFLMEQRGMVSITPWNRRALVGFVVLLTAFQVFLLITGREDFWST